MNTYVVVWIGVEPGSSQRRPFASMIQSAALLEAVRECDRLYGTRMGFEILSAQKAT